MDESDRDSARLLVFELKRLAYSIALLFMLGSCVLLPRAMRRAFVFPVVDVEALLRVLLWMFAALAAVGLTGLAVMTARCPRCRGAFVTRRTIFPLRCHSCGFEAS
jgi:hypothetical protein